MRFIYDMSDTAFTFIMSMILTLSIGYNSYRDAQLRKEVRLLKTTMEQVQQSTKNDTCEFRYPTK